MPNLREPLVRKHIHRWVIEEREKARAHDHWRGGAPEKLQRRCEDCGDRSWTETWYPEDHLVKGYEAVADLYWSPGKIPVPKLEGLGPSTPVHAPVPPLVRAIAFGTRVRFMNCGKPTSYTGTVVDPKGRAFKIDETFVEWDHVPGSPCWNKTDSLEVL